MMNYQHSHLKLRLNLISQNWRQTPDCKHWYRVKLFYLMNTMGRAVLFRLIELSKQLGAIFLLMFHIKHLSEHTEEVFSDSNKCASRELRRNPYKCLNNDHNISATTNFTLIYFSRLCSLPFSFIDSKFSWKGCLILNCIEWIDFCIFKLPTLRLKPDRTRYWFCMVYSPIDLPIICMHEGKQT